MLGISYFKAEPTEYARISVGGKTKKEGKGISKMIWQQYRTSVEVVPLSLVEHPFVFNELSGDNQQMSLQGGLVYAVSEPNVMLQRFNFSVDPKTKDYHTDDNTKLPEQITMLAHNKAREIIQGTPLETLIKMGDRLAKEVTASLKVSEELKSLGVNVDMVYFSYIKPNSEIAKAIEAPFRESLLKHADEAIYARRAAAVEQERTIKNNELDTEIALEERKKELLEEKEKNVLKEAEFNAKATELGLAVYNNMTPEQLIGLGLYKIGENAQKIENLSITPELLGSLMGQVSKKR